MPFRFNLFRAPEGLGPLQTWEQEHREPLGTRSEIRSALDQVLSGLRWDESPSMSFASGLLEGEAHAFEISLFGAADDILMEIDVYSRPPAIRAVMSGLRLNYCYAQESGKLCFPFEAGDDWPGASSIP